MNSSCTHAAKLRKIYLNSADPLKSSTRTPFKVNAFLPIIKSNKTNFSP